jgi:membrane-associated phospholipid phosphatase
MAHMLAGNALLMLGAGITLLAAGTVLVAWLAGVAARNRERLWSWIDLIVPGHLWRPRTYLGVHLALGFVLVFSAVAFVAIAENIVAGRELAAFDLAFAQALGEHVSARWHSLFWYLTFLGSLPAIAGIAIVVGWMLNRRHERLFLNLWIVSQSGAALLTYGLKLLFSRARPAGADPLLYGGGWSFPSGHAMGTLVLCGVAAYLLARLTRWRGAVAVQIAGLLAWALVMGFSRLYLGVHYVSDVIAGFLAGWAWIAVCVSGAEVALSRRRPSRL